MAKTEKNAANMLVETFFDQETATFSYVLSDPLTKQCAIIDPVLDYDIFSASYRTGSADKIIAYVRENGLNVSWILETHAHADHLTAAHYLKAKLGGQIAIGERIKEVLAYWVPILDTADDTPLDGSQFDRLLKDGEILSLGGLELRVINTPGHTPACLSYWAQDFVWVGDTIFRPEIGTARADFPGACARELYRSIKKILALPYQTRILVGHDYPSHGQVPQNSFSIAEQKRFNSMVRDEVSEDEYVKAREAKDRSKPVPRLLWPAIQVNLRAGRIGSCLKIPLNHFC